MKLASALVLLLSMIGQLPRAQAFNIIEWIRPQINNPEPQIAALGRAVSDGVTLGQAGRDRDHEAAERDRTVALERERASAEMKTRETQHLKDAIAISEKMKTALEENREDLVTLQRQFKSYFDANLKLVGLIDANSNYNEYFVTVLTGQREDLGRWLKRLEDRNASAEPNERRQTGLLIDGLRSKTALYWAEIASLPKADSPQSLMDQSLNLGSEVDQLIQALIASTTNRLEDTLGKIKAFQTQLNALTGQAK